MARRSLLVAIAAIATAVLPAAAQAATPGLTSAQYASPVTFAWTPDSGVLAEGLLRATGACPQVGTQIALVVPGNPSTASDTPGDGVFCYAIQNDPILGSVGPGVTVTVDTLPPTSSTVAVTPNPARGVATITGGGTDTATALTNAAHLGTVGCDINSPTIPNAWDTTTVADGTYLVCNVATDAAGHSLASTPQSVVVDNTAPLGAMATPVAGATVGGNAVALTTTGVIDATAGVRNVQWQRSAAGVAPWRNVGGAVTNAANGYLVAWNTQAAGNAGAGGDGPDFLRAVVTDNAGNVLNTPATAVTVDNTAPDAKAVLSAPPAVAGSPTLSWTPAHDAIGIARYDVLRGGNVIGTVTSNGAPSYSFNDKNAPDQATSNYVVRADDGANHSIDSDTVSVLVDSKAQSAPVGLTAATPTASAPALSWQAPPVFTVAHYDVYRDGVLLGSTTGAATAYSDATATEGVHDYAVLARSASAQPGVLSASFKVILDKTAPVSGGAPNAQVGATGGVQLAWPAASDALSGIAGYVVRRAAGGVPPAAADGGIGVCAPTATSCADSATASGTWSYGVFARDGAGNIALIGTVANVVIVDKTAPLSPTKLSLVKPKAKKTGANITFTLRWVKPTAPDLERVVVVLNLKRAPTAPADGKTIYKGLGTSAKVHLHAGQTGYLALYAYDHSGNVSLKPARTVVRLASLIPLRPLNGSVVRKASPTLTWKAKKGTAYYNVQVFVKGKRVLTGWPSKASYSIPAGKLVPGTYVWFVWPAVQGKGSSPTFGKLIGRATFTYKK